MYINDMSHNCGSTLLVLLHNTNTMVIQCATLKPACADQGTGENYLGSRNLHQMYSCWIQGGSPGSLLESSLWCCQIDAGSREVEDMTEISCVCSAIDADSQPNTSGQ